MKCHVCGSDMNMILTNLPFKISESSIVILKNLPVYQCCGCSEYQLNDSVISHIDRIFDRIDTETELEIVKYAA